MTSEEDGKTIDLEVPSKPAEAEDTATQSQGTSTAIALVTHSAQLGQYPVSDTLRAFGDVRGDSGKALLIAITSLIEKELVDRRSDLARMSAELHELQQKYHEEREKSAVLKEKLSGARRIGILQKMLLTGGGLLASDGVARMRSGQPDVGVLLFSIGVLLLLGGWLWPSGSGGREP